jgi:RHS repeat-associated protein
LPVHFSAGRSLGSVRLVQNVASGSLNDKPFQAEYTAFGEMTFQGTATPDWLPFGFAGGLYDHDTKLVRFGARDYDPVIGRWTAKDPILWDGGDSNLYAYVGNDPVNFIDPTGLLEGVPEWLENFDNSGGLQALGDFFAGAASAASFGISDHIIDATGLGKYGSMCSTGRRIGEYSVYAIALGRLAYAGLAKAGATALRGTGNLQQAVAWRNGLKLAFRFPASLSRFGQTRMYTASQMLAKYGTAEAGIAAAGRTDLLSNVYAGAQLGYGALH